jgi:hypothetical protein
MTDEQPPAPAGDMTCITCGNPTQPSGSCDAGCPVVPASAEEQPALDG